MVSDPGEYRWSSYGAVIGSRTPLVETPLVEKVLDIDLSPVRAGMVSDPGEYRWSSYGEVIGSRAFVDGVFRGCRDRFGEKRTSGARKLRSHAAAAAAAAAAAGVLWSVRDLQKGIG